MISRFEDLFKLFEEIDMTLLEKADFFIIGGTMLLYHELKKSTKDVDIIVDSRQEFLSVQEALKKIMFTTKAPTIEYKNVDLSQIFLRNDFRIDLFFKVVCKGFQLSETMKKRAEKVRSYDHLDVYLCSYEDVFLFKTFTERPGDIEDCIALAQKQIALDWEAILKEVKNQIKISGKRVWITWIGERLDILEDKGLNIPIMKEINKLREDLFKDLEENEII
jgi:hypothetical protein